jgi:GT2 family glycosyltransferase
MKTAAVILNHNLPDWTDRLYKTLKPYERDDYEVLVFDNGSKPEGTSQYTSFRSETNLYFGGGLNAAMQMVLDDEQYDSLLFVSNDLTIHPYNFVRTLREEMFQNETTPIFDVVAPCFYNVESDGQCHWRTMHCWASKTIREVPFADFQCPLLSRRIIKEVGQLHPSLAPGWGIDTLFAMICRDKGYKVGVVDRVCILHHNSLTVKKGVAGINIQQYCQMAEEGQREFFWNVIKRPGE